MKARIRMKKKYGKFRCLSGMAVLAAILAWGDGANAQVFGTYTGDLVATFRKTGIHQGTYEMVADIGNITNFLAMGQGSSLNITSYTPAQLSQAFPDGYADLQWGVFATFPQASSWITPLGSFPQATLWFTLATADANSSTNPPIRESVSANAPTRQDILGIENGASIISTETATNQTLLVTVQIELASDMQNNVTAFIGSKTDPSFGDFNGYTYYLSFEGLTPDTFSAPGRCDLFQACPTSKLGVVNKDPITGQTNGPAYRVGFFLLNPDGTMKFTRQSASSIGNPPPPPPLLSAVRLDTATTISLTTTNGATYTLYFTNSAGLGSPVTNWPSLPGTITGDGTVQSFIDSSTDAERFYSVVAH